VLQLAGGSTRIVSTTVLPGTRGALGMALSHNGRWLAVTTSSATELVSVDAVLSAVPNPHILTLADSGSGPIEAAFSADDRYLFVTDEGSAQLSVFDVEPAVSTGLASPAVKVGRVPLGPAPVGVVVSPGGEWVYVTTEGTSRASGQLWVIGAATAEEDPTAAVVSHVDAGCQTVRVALTPSGNVAWVTARGSNLLLGFDTVALRTDPKSALRASVRVGEEPVGLALFDQGQRAVVANSARFAAPGGPETLTLVDLGAALAKRPAIIGWVTAGAFPRELAVDGSVGVVTNFDSGTVDVFSLPG
jgi:DNA-binding beta-propeller fold protein YncE